MTKYNNKKVVLNGITFDSQKEARRYRDLSLLERAGEIKDLELQKAFISPPPLGACPPDVFPVATFAVTPPPPPIP